MLLHLSSKKPRTKPRVEREGAMISPPRMRSLSAGKEALEGSLEA
jgi:hypothetical protein